MWGSRFFAALFWASRYFSATGSDIIPIPPYECFIDQTTALSLDPYDNTTFLTVFADMTTTLTSEIDFITALSLTPYDNTTTITEFYDMTTELC